MASDHLRSMKAMTGCYRIGREMTCQGQICAAKDLCVSGCSAISRMPDLCLLQKWYRVRKGCQSGMTSNGCGVRFSITDNKTGSVDQIMDCI